ncbi:methenyltetrahydrofolate synthase domain-containing protein isoform X2 [Microcaecilia unicolor]|uniref:Methenyltetrahydrofolate synthase domain-containing protein n=1 Tax=Microcaecilia unicolor TaxID=1415580 RepID=A0A6P7Y5Z4_9AMPH|nr:methenyltetrahydrofolate synthase domain-containing protein isoform X2 [Microcaecilia unicolor]
MEPAIKLSAGVSKWDIRQKVWDYIEDHNLADFPRPVHHRIPNFKGAAQAAGQLPSLQEFRNAKTIKVNPDAPQKNARFLILEARKMLLVPTPRLRSGLFNKIIPPLGASKDILRVCATSQGVKEYSVPIGLDAKVHVDLVVVGSVAVSHKGWRIGKGEGFADMEYAMMATMGAVGENTTVVTIVHDCQVVDIPEELVADHDLTVDYILTPTRIIKTDCKRAKPQAIIWSKVTWELMQRIPILKSLQDRERQAGKDVRLKDERTSEDKEKTALMGAAGAEPRLPNSQSRSARVGQRDLQSNTEAVTTVYVGNIPQSMRAGEFKNMLRESNASPVRLSWQGAQHRAFLDYKDASAAQRVVSSLQGLNISGNTLLVELSTSRRSRMSGNPLSQKQD